MNTDVVICSQPEFLDRNFEWITGVVFTASYWDRNLEKKRNTWKKNHVPSFKPNLYFWRPKANVHVNEGIIVKT